MSATDCLPAREGGGHLYARECCANTWYAIGAVHWHRGDRAAAHAAFLEALARVPTHPMAGAGMALRSGERPADLHSQTPLSINAAVAHAVLLVADGDTPAAVRIASAALASTPPGSGGWTLPIDPLLRVEQSREAWRPVLLTLCDRAT